MIISGGADPSQFPAEEAGIVNQFKGVGPVKNGKGMEPVRARPSLPPVGDALHRIFPPFPDEPHGLEAGLEEKRSDLDRFVDFGHHGGSEHPQDGGDFSQDPEIGKFFRRHPKGGVGRIGGAKLRPPPL